MGYLAMRVPVQFSPAQYRVIIIILAVVVMLVLVGAVLDTFLGGGVALILRLLGVKPPRKSTFQMSLDELEARLKEREDRPQR